MFDVIHASFPYLATLLIAKLMADRKILTPAFSKGLGKLLFSIVLPAIILKTLMNTDINSDTFIHTAVSAFASTAAVTIAWLIAKKLKYNAKQTGALMIAFTAVSLGTIVYPLSELNFGTDVLEEVILFDAMGNFIYVLVGGLLIAQWWSDKDHSFKEQATGVIKTPLVIAIAIGVVLSLLNFQNETVSDLLNYITAGFGFAIAVLVGSNLKIPTRETLRDILGIVLVRAVVFAALIALAVYVINPSENQSIALLLSSLGPVTASGLILVQEYSLDVKAYSQYVTVSLLMSLVAFPFMISFLS